MKTSITAIESASWETPLVLRGDFIDSIRKAAKLGYDGIELHIKDSSTLDQKQILSCLKENHLVLTSIGTGPSYSQDKVFLTHGKEEIRQEALRRMKGHIELGAKTDAVVIIGLMKGQKKNGENPQLYRDYFRYGMEECIREAEKFGVTLAFEVIDRFESDWLITIEEGLMLLEEFDSDNLTLHLDTFHMNIEEPDCAKSIIRAGEKIGHVHVADSDRWYPGHAHYDFESTFSALKEVGYKGAVALESFLYPDPDTAAKLGLEYIHRFI